MRLSCSTEISRPPEIVFPWIAEPEKAMEWQKGVKGGEIITSKPEVVGTTFKELIAEDGNELEMLGEITGYTPNRFMSFHLNSRIHEFDVSYSLEELENGTKISIEATVRWKFPMDVITLVIGRTIKDKLARQMKDESAELKRICENM